MKRPWLALAAQREPYLRRDDLSTKNSHDAAMLDDEPTKRRCDAATQEPRQAVKQANAASQKPDEAMEREKRRWCQTCCTALCGLTLELSRPATYESVSCVSGTTTHLNQVEMRVRLERIVRAHWSALDCGAANESPPATKALQQAPAQLRR